MSSAPNLSDQKTIVVVLGMPRSGTSALARGLKALGIHLGEKFAEADGSWNPKGFWEDTDIVYQINRGIMFELKYSWLSTTLIEKKAFDETSLHALKTQAIDLINARMAKTDCFGFKDPRTSKVLPFWQDVFSALKLNDKYVIALRNPLASAYSYQRLSGEDLEIGLLLWLMHLVPAIQYSFDKNCLVVSYEHLMDDPHQQLKRIETKLHLPKLARKQELDFYAQEFLDKKLKHYDYSMQDLITHPATRVSSICIPLYDLLLRLAKDEISFNDPSFLSEWKIITREFNQLYPVYAYIDKLLKENNQFEKKLRSMQKSIPWRMIYPLRIIDDFLRSRRRKRRAQKRLVSTDESRT